MPSLKYYQHTILFFLLILLVSGLAVRQAAKQIQKVSHAFAVDIAPGEGFRETPSGDLRRLRLNAGAKKAPCFAAGKGEDWTGASQMPGRGIAK